MKVRVLSNFAVGHTHLGKSVFAARPFKKGDVITQFTGPLIHRLELPEEYKGEDDRYVQIGPYVFMGPSGGIDDLINHSCEPNAGLRFNENEVLLIALEDIAEGDEITWDYSTTMFNSSWKMKCDCKKNACRKIVGDFTLLPAELQQHYRDLNVIPNYIKEYMESPEYTVNVAGIQQLQNAQRDR